MAQQGQPYPIPWGLHYQHRDSATPTSTGRPYEHPHTQTHQLYSRHAHTHGHTLIDQHEPCKGEGDETRPEYRDYTEQLHRCSSYGKCVDEVPEEARDRDEAVTSTEHHQHWDEKIVSSSLCSTSAPTSSTRTDAASPHQHVTTTHAGGGRRGALQLWQFLVSLLAEGARCVAWTGRGLEFKLHEPEEVVDRIQGVDLVAHNAVYHRPCYARFCLASRGSCSNNIGRPTSDAVALKMAIIFNYIEENKDKCQFTLAELKKVVDDPPSNPTVRGKVEERYGKNFLIHIQTRCVSKDIETEDDEEATYKELRNDDASPEPSTTKRRRILNS